LDRIASLESTVADLKAKLARTAVPAPDPENANDIPVLEAHKCYCLQDITWDRYWKYVAFRRDVCRNEGRKTASYLTYEQWVEKWMSILVPVENVPLVLAPAEGTPEAAAELAAVIADCPF
jgi:hypothetical protein